VYVCTLAVPIIAPSLPTWRELTKSQGVNYNDLSYEEFCTGEGFQQKARNFFETFAGPIAGSTAGWIGVSGFLRGAEAMDSVKNFVDAAQADEGEWVIGYILCGVVEVFLLHIRTNTKHTFLTLCLATCVFCSSEA
jgi:hypothetical protein